MPPLNKFTRSCLALAISQAVITPVNAANIEVNTNSDAGGADANCTLREAIISANTDPISGTSGCVDGNGADTITFNTVGSLIFLASGQLTITEDVSITGPGPSSLTIHGNNLSNVFNIAGGGTNPIVSLSGMTITGGSTGSTGGGISVYQSNLTIDDCILEGNTSGTYGGGIFSGYSDLDISNSTFSANKANSGGALFSSNGYGSVSISNTNITENSATSVGGGIYVNESILTVENSTLSNNSSGYSGAGLNISSNNTVVIVNSTISGNSTYNRGGGIRVSDSSSLSIFNSTITENETFLGADSFSYTGGGIHVSYTAKLTIQNTIVSGNSSKKGPEIRAENGTTITLTNNVFGDDRFYSNVAFDGVTLGLTNVLTTSDYLNIPLISILQPLEDNGGSTETHLLSIGSPAIDAGVACASAPVSNLDQRGTTRDGSCDIGATERLTKSIVVDSALDTTGNGGICTLRDAINSSNTNSVVGGCAVGGDSSLITFDPTTFPVSATNQITLLSSLPIIAADTTITGNAASGMIINAGSTGRVLTISKTNVELTNLTLTGGSATNGGGISVGDSNLSLDNSTISGNFADSFGGGIESHSSSIDLSNTTVSTNLATNGAGLFIFENNNVNLINSTVSGNVAGNIGGGIYAYKSNSISLSNSLVAGNNATNGAEIGNYMSTFTANKNNLFGDSSHTYGQAFQNFTPGANDIYATEFSPQATALTSILEPLADNGGASQTHALVARSPAIDAGYNVVCAAPPINNLDQRGEVRPVGSACDIGAFEGFIEDSSFYVVPLPGGGSVIFSL